MSFLLLGVCLAAPALGAQDLPEILIYQQKPSAKAEGEMNISMANFLATEFDSEGKALPIVYGETDPAFRGAIEDGKIRDVPKWPTLRQGVDLAHRMGARYVLIYEFGAMQKGESNSLATLYFDGRKIWSERLSVGVRRASGLSADESGRSIARTWVVHICSGPLKYVMARPKLAVPEAAVGQEPKPVDPTPPVKVDSDGALKTRVESLIQAEDMSRAISVLRDAVDQEPFDVDRRILLVQTLLDCHRSSEAGDEADRAVLLAPDRQELRALAARAWMAAGRKEDARNVLNETLVRDPQGAQTHLMLAELSLARQEPDKAIEHLDLAIKSHPTRQALYLRALGRAMLGNLDAVNADLAQAAKLTDSVSAGDLLRVYALSASSIDDSLKAMVDDTRLLMQRALVHPDDVATRDKVAGHLKLLQARAAYLGGFPVPTAYKSSNDRRVLAHSLLVQSMLAIQSFFTGGGQDSMTDARVDLGEALKAAANARSAFESEQKIVASGADPKSPTVKGL